VEKCNKSEVDERGAAVEVEYSVAAAAREMPIWSGNIEDEGDGEGERRRRIWNRRESRAKGDDDDDEEEQ